MKNALTAADDLADIDSVLSSDSSFPVQLVMVEALGVVAARVLVAQLQN